MRNSQSRTRWASPVCGESSPSCSLPPTLSHFPASEAEIILGRGGFDTPTLQQCRGRRREGKSSLRRTGDPRSEAVLSPRPPGCAQKGSEDPSSSSVPTAMRAAPRDLKHEHLTAGSLLPHSPPRAARQGFIAHQHPSLTLQMPKRANQRGFGPKGTDGGAAQPLASTCSVPLAARTGVTPNEAPFGHYIPSAPPQARQGFNKTKPDRKKKPQATEGAAA